VLDDSVAAFDLATPRLEFILTSAAEDGEEKEGGDSGGGGGGGGDGGGGGGGGGDGGDGGDGSDDVVREALLRSTRVRLNGDLLEVGAS